MPEPERVTLNVYCVGVGAGVLGDDMPVLLPLDELDELLPPQAARSSVAAINAEKRSICKRIFITPTRPE